MSDFFINDYITDDSEFQALITSSDELLQTLSIKYRHKMRLYGKLQDIFAKSTADSFLQCGEYLEIAENGKILHGCFCHNRYCPICNYLSSRAKYARVIQTVQKMPDYKFVFVTATIRNVTGQNLRNALEGLSVAFHRFQNRKPMSNLSQGYFRTTEITYNAKTNTFHPHIHLLVALPDDYYEKHYVSAYDWRIAWEKSARLDYTAQVDIRAVADDENLYKAVAEISKYCLKMSDVMECEDLEVINELVKATKGKRLVNASGCFKNLEYVKFESEGLNSCGYQQQNGVYVPIHYFS